MQPESLEFDLLIVGGGPAGLAAAIRARQRAISAGQDLSVCLLDKASEIGAHIISGALVDPRGLDELLPNWRKQGAPLHTRITDDRFLLLSAQRSWRIPAALLPASLHNTGMYAGSLGELCRWLAQEAESLGVEVFPGFAAQSLLHDANGAVCGVLTGDMGRRRDGSPGPAFAPATAIYARHTLLAEGARGHLGKHVEQIFSLRAQSEPQTFSLGLKELWQIPAERHQPGLAIHAAAWPLSGSTSGGAFCYHYGEGRVALGLIAGLEFRNPHFSPFDTFQRLKTHPLFSKMLAGGECLSFGARSLATGGWQSLPKLEFPGGALIGDDAGFLDAARNKGIHTAMKSGMLAAEAAIAQLSAQSGRYTADVRRSWLGEDLRRARNFKPALKCGLILGSLLAGIDQRLLRGKAPWTLRNTSDHDRLMSASTAPTEPSFKPDEQRTFSRSSAVYHARVQHSEDQPCHLQLRDPTLAISLNHARYASPETRYCPAGVYEIIAAPSPRLQINASNCMHCKACDIKDPGQNIDWTPPQAGEGPYYAAM